MSQRTVSIGELARRTGCKVPTVRYYESIGLIPRPARSTGNQRRYGPEDLARLDFIQHCRELGFSQEDIRELLGLTDCPGRPCNSVTAVVKSHLDGVVERIARLERLRMELERMIANCAGGKVSDCRILEVLADHQHKHCLSDAHQI